MAEEWNTCASLADDASFSEAKTKYDSLLKEGKDPFSYMLQMQYDLQKALYKRLPDQVKDVDSLETLGEKYEWLRDNKIAADDEFAELIDSLPGMSNMSAKDRTSLWKKWKGKHKNVQAMKFSDLSIEDQKEAKFEMTDIFHFSTLNFLLGMNMTGEELFCYYYLKNAENHNRANSGY